MDNLCRLKIVHGIIVANTMFWTFLAVAAHWSLFIPALSMAAAGIFIEPVMREEKWRKYE